MEEDLVQRDMQDGDDVRTELSDEEAIAAKKQSNEVLAIAVAIGTAIS